MLGVIVLFFGGSVATYLGAFKPVTNVLLRADRTGNQLQPESDVKVRGLTVGEVRDISSRGDGASLRLELHRDKVGMIPANVSARLIPKTLFGEEVRGQARPPLLPLPARSAEPAGRSTARRLASFAGSSRWESAVVAEPARAFVRAVLGQRCGFDGTGVSFEPIGSRAVELAGGA